MHKMLAVMLAFVLAAGGQIIGGDASLSTPAQKSGYALGVLLAGRASREMGPNLMVVDLDALSKGVKDSLEGGKLKLTDDEINQALNGLREALIKLAADNQAKGDKFLEANKSQPGVKTTASGLQYIMTTEGTGATPKMGDTVTVHYKGSLITGKEFDSSYKRGEPTSFELGKVIAGWNEALQLMKEGGKIRIFVPSNLAYGQGGSAPEIGPNEPLIFEIELIKVAPAAAAPSGK